MADFNISYAITANNEGTYDNNPNDTGGETVMGVSRNNFPKWEGWAIVDRYANSLGRGSSAFRAALQGDQALKDLVKSWYKVNFWEPFQLDALRLQSLANEIFDQAVNLGVGQSTRFIQRAFNALNDKFQFGADLKVDGAIGPMTRSAIATLGNNNNFADVFRKALDSLQGAFYVELGLKERPQDSGKYPYRSFTRGWFRTRIGEMV